MKRSVRGLPFLTDGTEELIQRAMIRLSVRHGSFAPDKDLGSELYTLNTTGGRDMDTAAMNLVRQALLPLPQITVTQVSCTLSGDSLRIKLQIIIDRKTKALEVEIR
ncbi:histidine kinase [Hydrogenoanaerobacterium sp.]|uniref:histidine kinase n=1 Tax=Hydrogenoanaerobacterium sp. TaxID=2953763 RepID=UPI00289B05BE|nr:histidine kinase [Hydrogenoanaerobacterium sp.]